MSRSGIGLWAPKGTPKDVGREAQCRGEGSARRSGRAREARSAWPGDPARRAADRRKRWPRIRRRRSRSGGRSSRPPTSRSSDFRPILGYDLGRADDARPSACQDRMPDKFIDYYDAMSSPWTYLGHQRFEQLAQRFGLTIRHKPMDLLKVWSVSGGLPLKQRAQQRQDYRHLELKRWSEILQHPVQSGAGLSSGRRPARLLSGDRGDAAGARLEPADARASCARSGSRTATSPTIRHWSPSPTRTAWMARRLLAATEDEAVKAEYQANTEEAIRHRRVRCAGLCI